MRQSFKQTLMWAAISALAAACGVTRFAEPPPMPVKTAQDRAKSDRLRRRLKMFSDQPFVRRPQRLSEVPQTLVLRPQAYRLTPGLPSQELQVTSAQWSDLQPVLDSDDEAEFVLQDYGRGRFVAQGAPPLICIAVERFDTADEQARDFLQRELFCQLKDSSAPAAKPTK